MRTPAHTLQAISSRVTSQQCKFVYDNLVAETDLLDAPRDSRVVQNKKYNDGVKLRKNDTNFQANFSDEIQAVCSMVVHDDFVQSVTLSHACVPCVVLYKARQIEELKAFCFNKRYGSVWSLDKTYNLGHVYVTVTVYRNVALQRNGTNTAPTF